MTNPIDVDADAARLAAELASLLGRERGNLLLQQARTAVLAESAKPGTETSEFKMALLGVVSGFAVLALGAYLVQPDLSDRGMDLVQWSIAGYVVARGVAKSGIGK